MRSDVPSFCVKLRSALPPVSRVAEGSIQDTHVSITTIRRIPQPWQMVSIIHVAPHLFRYNWICHPLALYFQCPTLVASFIRIITMPRETTRFLEACEMERRCLVDYHACMTKDLSELMALGSLTCMIRYEKVLHSQYLIEEFHHKRTCRLKLYLRKFTTGQGSAVTWLRWQIEFPNRKKVLNCTSSVSMHTL
jgi:hypothetical protein